MEIHPSLDALPDPPLEPVATMGNFDGVHRGHQAILGRLKEEAARLGAPTLVITFQPHPRQVLRPDEPFHPIMSLRERLRRLWDLQIDHALVLPFDADLAELTAREFVEEVLWDSLRVRAMYVGPNTAFGHRREGDVRYLTSEGLRLGFHTDKVDPIFLHGQRISSTWVRGAIMSGDMPLAAQLMGRHHQLVGEVVRGDGRGHELGFPTANISTDGGLIPPIGVYAAWARTEAGDRKRAVVNIGVRPTFEGDGRIVVEAHLLDGFSADLYGQTLILSVVRHLRAEAKFPSVAQLKRQVKTDIVEAKRTLGTP